MALGSKAEVCSLVQLGMTMSRGSGWDEKWAPTAGFSRRAGGGPNPGEFSFKYLDFSEESTCSAGDPGPIPGSGRSPGEGNGNSLLYPCLESLGDRGVLWAAVHGVAKSRARLSD